MKTLAAAACIAALVPSHAYAQALLHDAPTCIAGAALAGTVRDSTGASVGEADVTVDTGETTKTSADGRFSFRCLPDTAHALHITAESFAATDLTLSAAARTRADLNVTLHPESVEQLVEVSGAAPVRGVDNAENGSSRTIQGDDLRRSRMTRMICCVSCNN